MQDAKRRAIIFVVIALALSSLAAYLFMQEVSAVQGRLGNMTTVYVATKDIKSRETLQEAYFKPVEVPTKFVQDTAVTDLKQIQLGKYRYQITQLVTVVPIPKDGILTTNMLKEQSALTSNDRRMVTIAKSDRIVFDGNFDYNDRVDIIVSKRSGDAPVTKTFMRDVLVVGVAKDNNGEVVGLGLEMTLDRAEQFIHEQNFAAAIRVLKAPSEKGNRTSQPQEIPARQENPQHDHEGADGQPPSSDPNDAKPEDEITE